MLVVQIFYRMSETTSCYLVIPHWSATVKALHTSIVPGVIVNQLAKGKAAHVWQLK